MALMTNADWQMFEDSMNQWQEDAFQEEIILHKRVVGLSRDGDDSNERFESINIKGLVHYNYFRAWPINTPTDSGEIDKENIMLYLNLNHLESLSLLDSNRNLKFDPPIDRFEIRGLTYKASGESHVSQANNKPLFMFIILKREELKTGTKKYG